MIRPIILNGPEVRAVLDGRKTHHCVILKPQPDTLNGGTIWSGPMFGPLAYNGTWPDGTRSIQLPPFLPGHKAWVRETWGLGLSDHGDCPRYRATMDYMCGDKIAEDGPFKWRSPVTMPRWASRLTLTVKAVRVFRVQEITEAEARAEGAEWVSPTYGFAGIPESWGLTAIGAFRGFWNARHGADAWDRNAWVAGLTFTAHRCNVDQMP